jgi:hypothetical protein
MSAMAEAVPSVAPEIVAASVTAPPEIVVIEPTPVTPRALQNATADDDARVPEIVVPQAAVPAPGPAGEKPKIVTPEPVPLLVPVAAKSIVDEAADDSVTPAQTITAPMQSRVASAAANDTIPVVAATPIAAVCHTASAYVAQPAPVTAPVPAAAAAHAPTLPFKPLPKSAQSPVTVPPKRSRSATDFISYEDYKKRSLKRWQIRSVIVTAILLSAILALAILGRSQSKRGITPHSFDNSSGSIGPLGSNLSSENGMSSYDAAPLETNDGLILTVAASANQSIRDVSLRYIGHFDTKLSKQILLLNPDLKNPDHLQDGQLIRIPLPTGALKKTNDTGDAASTDASGDSVGLLGKLDALLRGQK